MASGKNLSAARGAKAESGKSKQIKKKARTKPKGKFKSSRRAVAKVPPLPPPRGKVVVFPFRGDDLGPASVHAQVVRALRLKGLTVITTVRPVDSAEQFREMAVTLDLAAYVHGEINDDGDHPRATVHIRSGVTGLRVASAKFVADRGKLPSEVGKGFWTEVGPAFSRVCADAATKPRKLERAPMRIEAGTPIESSPADSEGT